MPLTPCLTRSETRRASSFLLGRGGGGLLLLLSFPAASSDCRISSALADTLLGDTGADLAGGGGGGGSASSSSLTMPLSSTGRRRNDFFLPFFMLPTDMRSAHVVRGRPTDLMRQKCLHGNVFGATATKRLGGAGLHPGDVASHASEKKSRAFGGSLGRDGGSIGRRYREWRVRTCRLSFAARSILRLSCKDHRGASGTPALQVNRRKYSSNDERVCGGYKVIRMLVVVCLFDAGRCD